MNKKCDLKWYISGMEGCQPIISQ